MNQTEDYRAASADSNGSGPDDPRVLRAVEEYLAALEAGQAPGRDEFLGRHADIAARLGEYLDGLDLIHRAGSAAGPLAGGPVAGGDAAADDLAGAEPLGDFLLVRELGRGGMGVVYEAVQRSLNRRVALKVLPFAGGLDARQLQRFKNEAQAAACMHHPNIVPVFGVGCERSVHYYAMQLIDGQTLAATIADLRQDGGRTAHLSEAPTPSADTAPQAAASTERAPRDRAYFRRVAELGIQAAEALDYAHGLGVVHRDVKPANLIVDGRGGLWVTDFGLAHMQSDARLTMTGDLVGTLRYMSPEQALGKRVVVDHRTDVYSLGATLYELLTLEPVFAGDDRQELLRQIAFEEPKPPRRINKAIPTELETIVLKAVEKNPVERYGSARELADDVRRFLLDKPVHARRPGLAQHAAKWMRRNRTLVWSAALAFVTTLAVLAGSIGYIVRDRMVRLTEAEQKGAAALSGARTAIEAGDLSLAGRRVAEARGHLGTELAHATAVAEDIDRMQREIEARQSDDTRFRQFLKQTQQAQDRMSYSKDDLAEQQAREALDLYGVLERQGWSARLEDSYLTPGQKDQVRETAFVTLVSLADYRVRWHWEDTQSRQKSLALLERAEAFHLPTRAFYFVRSECYRQEGNKSAADADVKRFQATPARTAWDHYLPGHTAGWRGDLKEAIRSYEAALALQPNHYNSLFFLADRFTRKEIHRWPEAVQLFTGCIALRPDHVWAYYSRGECHQELGQMDRAEADYSAALAVASSLEDKLAACKRRRDFYEAVGDTEKHRKDALRFVELNEQLVAERKATLSPCTLASMDQLGREYVATGRLPEAIALLEDVVQQVKVKNGVDHSDTLICMYNLGTAYLKSGRPAEAIALLKPAMEKRTTASGPDHPETLRCTGCLAWAYADVGRLPEALALLEPALEKFKVKLGPDHPDTLACMSILERVFIQAGRPPQAVALMELRLKLTRSRFGPDHPAVLNTMHKLARLYETAGQPEHAQKLWMGEVERVRKTENATPAFLASQLAILGLNLLNQKKYAQAEPFLRESLTIRAKHLPDSWLHFNAMSMLGGALAGQQHYAATESLLLQGYEGMKQRESTIPLEGMSRITDALERIVSFYDATGQAEHAHVWRSRISETTLKGALTDEEHAQLHAVKLDAGKTYVIDMKSTALDSYLKLYNAAGRLIAENDDMGPDILDARIVMTPKIAGVYRMTATSFVQRGRGAYTLTIRAVGK